MQNGSQVIGNSQWNIVQTGGDIELWVDSIFCCNGAIDTDSGDFEFFLTNNHPCGPNTVGGNVAADGLTFTGIQEISFYGGSCHPTLGCNPECVSGVLTLDGSRCGNQQQDDGEDCDDGNRQGGDCCSASCTLDTVGTACATDYNLCTDDVCDGTGLCEHPFNAVPCADDEGCGTGNCADGACQITAPESVGTPCNADSNLCTSDECDGAGACAHPPLPQGTDCDFDDYECTSAACNGSGQCILDEASACAPCGTCGGEQGCVRDVEDTCDNTVRISIDLRLGEPERQRLKIKMKDQFFPSDLGDPATSTEYTVCLYENDRSGEDRVIGRVVVPPGGACDGEACWTERPNGFRYKDETLANDGIESMKLVDFKSITIMGEGSGLGLPAALSPETHSIYPKIISDDGVDRTCWYHDVFTRRSGPEVYRGRYN
ncbi:MAG: hypothetical protein ABR587_12575 [Candidatus Binatia bacterium]